MTKREISKYFGANSHAEGLYLFFIVLFSIYLFVKTDKMFACCTHWKKLRSLQCSTRHCLMYSQFLCLFVFIMSENPNVSDSMSLWLCLCVSNFVTVLFLVFSNTAFLEPIHCNWRDTVLNKFVCLHDCNFSMSLCFDVAMSLCRYVRSRYCVLARALASHRCVPGSIPGPDAISGLSLCWFSSLLRGFFSGFSGFPPSPKTNTQLIPAGCKLSPRSHMDRIAAARGAIVSCPFDLVELRRCCTLRRRLAVKIYI